MISSVSFRLKKNGEPYTNCICKNPELIENYEEAINDNTQVWECHHRREEFFSKKELIERGEYYNVKPADLIFLTPAEHSSIDSKCKRLSESMKGNKNPMYGKYHSEEAKRKISETHKGQIPWNRKKVLCVETGTIYESVREAAKLTNSNEFSIGNVCNGRSKTANSFHWKFIYNKGELICVE